MNYIGLAIAIVMIVIVVSPSRLGKFLRGERKLGKRAGAVLSDQWALETLAAIGGDDKPLYTFIKSAYPTTWGVRLLSVALTVVVYVHVLPMLDDQQAFGEIARYATEIRWGLTAILVYSVVYVWMFEITLDGSELEITTGFLGRKTFDLRDLKEVTEDGPYNWKLYFNGRAPVRAMKTVVGVHALRQHLGDVVKANRMEDARTPRG